ncbi:MAG: helix-turn-helix domain-containing protein [Oscillochloridaceae bacterium umkhey_bin13]
MRTYDESRMIGRRIAEARKRTGFSAQHLADKLGWSRETLVNFELGRRAITVERLSAIAAALNLHPAELLFERPDAAHLAAQIATNDALYTHVRFFVSSLEDDDEAATGF